ncbi:MAG: hypothetical protein ACLFNQ_02050 [Spirochaetaceae bacterium]
MKERLSLTVLIAAGIAFNFLLNTYRWLGSGYMATGFIPSAALASGVIVAYVAARWRISGSTRARRFIMPAASAFLAVMLIYSVAEGAIQFLYARPFIPYTDVSYVTGGMLLLFPESTTTVTALTPLVIFLILVAAYAVTRGFLGLAHRHFCRVPAPRRRYTMTAVGVLVVSLLGTVSIEAVSTPRRDTETWASALLPVMGQGFTSFDQFEVESRIATDTPADDPSEPAAASTQSFGLPGIRDADIYVFAIESYGITIFEDDVQRASLGPVLQSTSDTLNEAGYHIASSFLESPVFSGMSWLAEATFLSGNVIDRQSRFENLIETGAFTLPDFLEAEAGYYAMKAKPGAVHDDWPEGREVFGFDEMLIAHNGDFGYQGPWFSFVPVPDQFAIHALHNRIQSRIDDGTLAERPLFAYYQLVSSHMPFNHIPEYLPDWSDLGDGSVFFETENLRFDNDYFSGTEYVDGFIASIDYVLTVLTEYLTRFVPDDRESLIILYGDHQPGSVVSGRGASRSVPVHVVSRNRSVVQSFVDELAYNPGIIPDQPYPHLHMASFFPDFVRISTDTTAIEE